MIHICCYLIHIFFHDAYHGLLMHIYFFLIHIFGISACLSDMCHHLVRYRSSREVYTAIVTTVSMVSGVKVIKNKMAADVDGSRHFFSLSRQAQRDLHLEILSVLEYFKFRLDDYVIRSVIPLRTTERE